MRLYASVSWTTAEIPAGNRKRNYVWTCESDTVMKKINTQIDYPFKSIKKYSRRTEMLFDLERRNFHSMIINYKFMIIIEFECNFDNFIN